MRFLRLTSVTVFWLTYAFSICSCVDIDREGLPDTGLITDEWETGVLPPLDSMWELNDFQIAAKNTLAARWYGTCATL